MRRAELLIVGGGSAGMAAAVAAHRDGVRDILILERSGQLGGVLCQCIHNGFGLHRYHEELTGPEYARRNIDAVLEAGIPYMLHTFAVNITPDKVVSVVSAEEGAFDIQAKAVVLAMGCRERARGALMIPGTRPAGVLTAGTAQRYLNLQGYLPGRRVVILGSGDIGLIMARQFVLEGAEVEEVVELMPYSSGLTRNIAQCLHDFDIPLSLSSTVVEIRGRKRVSSVVVAKVDESRRPIPGTEREIACDTLLISAGLIPENELAKSAGVLLSKATKGAVVDDNLQTSVEGIFSSGNVLHVHDLVDNVSEESERAGHSAARYLSGELPCGPFSDCVPVVDGDGVGGVVPQFLQRAGRDGDKLKLMFRPKSVCRGGVVRVLADGRSVAAKRAFVLAPGEMCEIQVERAALAKSKELKVQVEV